MKDAGILRLKSAWVSLPDLVDELTGCCWAAGSCSSWGFKANSGITSCIKGRPKEFYRPEQVSNGSQVELRHLIVRLKAIWKGASLKDAPSTLDAKPQLG